MTDYPQPQRVDLLDKDALLSSLMTEAIARSEIREVIDRHAVTTQVLRARAVRESSTVFRAAESEEQAWREAKLPPGNRIVDKILAFMVLPTVQIAVLAWLLLHATKIVGVPQLVLVIGTELIVLVIGTFVLRRRNRAPDTSVGVGWVVLGLAAWLVDLGWLAFLWVGGSPALIPVGLLGALLFFMAFIPLGRVSSPSTAADRQKADERFATWQNVLMEKGLLPVLRTIINVRETEDDYSTTLAVTATPGLNSPDYLLTHVPTPASRRLVRLINSVAGGSFALAGPRGAGKTNLIRAYCSGQYRDDNRGPDLAVHTSAPVEYEPEQFVLHLFAKTCQAAIAYARQGSVGGTPDVKAVRGTRVAGVVQAALAPFAEELHPRPHQLRELATIAESCLSLIRYVRTYSAEAGAQGGVTGFQVSGKSGLSMAGRAFTYPELVDRFREFLADAVSVLEAEARSAGLAPGRVVIGIDELDRIGTGESARRLLNEIKAIFDVRGCYYLVSVSTEAQHDFELSGIGLRSTFDSSFDEVVRVDYLNFTDAKVLLRRHVIGLSEQFLAFAYVFSGGLARQLVRTVRTIVELAGSDGDQGLRSLARSLAEAELARACQATVDALITVPDDADVTELVQTLDDSAGVTTLAYCERVIASYRGESVVAKDLRDAVAARVYFLATMLEVFNENLTKEAMSTVNFDLLARARRYAGSSPATALALIDGVRALWTWPLLNPGAVNGGAAGA